MVAVVSAESLAEHINSGIRLMSMDMDLRADLIMCFGYDIEEVASMDSDQVVRILDEADEEENYPDKYKTATVSNALNAGTRLVLNS